MARECGGRLLLRIEDIDPQRCRPEYEAAIYEDLRWLGISWQEPVRRQSENFSDYQAAIAKLEADGLIYPSFESRSEINALVAERERQGSWPRDPDGVPLYPGDARNMPPAERERRRRAGEPFALRHRHGCRARARRVAHLDGDRKRAARPERPHHRRAANVGRRRSGAQGVADQLSSRRGRRRRLAGRDRRGARTGLVLVDQHPSPAAERCSALPEPVYHHHRLILDADGRKLSKATQATSLRELRAARRQRGGYQANGGA